MRRIQIDKSNLISVVTGDLLKFQNVDREMFCVENDKLVVFFREELSSEDINEKLIKFRISIAKLPFIFKLKYHFRIFNSVLIALLLTVFVGLLGAYGNAFYEILLKKYYGETLIFLDGNQMFIVMLTVFFSVIFLAPQLISSDFTSIQDWLDKRLSSKEKVHRRFAHEIKWILEKKNLSGVQLVNLLQYDDIESVLSNLVSSLKNHKKHIECNVRLDEVNQITSWFRENHQANFDFLQEEKINCKIKQHIESLQVIEQKVFALLMFCSTYQIEKDEASPNNEYELSVELASLIVERYNEKLEVFGGMDNAELLRIINRFKEDYYLIKESAVANRVYYQLTIPDNKAFDLVDFSHITEKLKLDVLSFMKEIEHPISSLLLFHFFKNDTYLNSNKKMAFQLLINNVDKYEYFKILRKYRTHLLEEKDNREENIYIVLSAVNLLDLAQLGLKSGLYIEALKAFKSAALVYPIKAKIGIAKVLERQGNYSLALDVISEVEKIVSKREDLQEEDKIASLRIFIEKAWIIVSARFINKKKEGKDALVNAGELLNQMDNIDYSVDYLFSYYNNVANYHEWDKQYESAIRSYENILSIPGMNVQPVSSTLINIGISYRLLGLEKKGRKLKIDCLKQSVDNLTNGVDLKIKIGDLDQYPIAIHNLAESLILLAIEKKNDDEKNALLYKGLECARKGLKVQTEIRSVKKKGQLLAEAIVSIRLLKKTDLKSEVKSYERELIQWKKENNSKYKFDLAAVNQILSYSDCS